MKKRFTKEQIAYALQQAEAAAAVLDEVVRQRGVPRVIKMDNSPEFTSKALDLWAFTNKVQLDFSRPGQPTDNAFIESCNGSFRQECLHQEWFASLEEARRKSGARWMDCHEARPHSSLGQLAPREYAAQYQAIPCLQAGKTDIAVGTDMG